MTTKPKVKFDPVVPPEMWDANFAKWDRARRRISTGVFQNARVRIAIRWKSFAATVGNPCWARPDPMAPYCTSAARTCGALQTESDDVITTGCEHNVCVWYAVNSIKQMIERSGTSKAELKKAILRGTESSAGPSAGRR